MKNALLIIGLLIIALNYNAQIEESYRKSLVNYEDYKKLVEEVESHRKERLINLNTFLKMSKEDSVIILDSRSKYRYDRKHIKGAVHLNFSDFTQEDLWKLIPPNKNIKILIYCNNNFTSESPFDLIDFPTKASRPIESITLNPDIAVMKKPITLALNIPTYINLYGYGYRNIYELDELVFMNDPRIEFEGTEVD